MVNLKLHFYCCNLTRTKAFRYAIKALVTHLRSQTCSPEQLYTPIPTTFGQPPWRATILTHIFKRRIKIDMYTSLRFYVKK